MRENWKGEEIGKGRTRSYFRVDLRLRYEGERAREGREKREREERYTVGKYSHQKSPFPALESARKS